MKTAIFSSVIAAVGLSTGFAADVSRLEIADGDEFVIDNFEGEVEYQSNLGVWFTYDDQENGGGSSITKSIVTSEIDSVSNKVLRAEFALDKGTLDYDPYVSVAVLLGENDSTTVDMSRCSEIHFSYRSSVGLNFRVQGPAVEDYAYHEYSLKKSTLWKKDSLTWNNFRQPTWTKTKVPFKAVQTAATMFEFNIQTTTGTSGYVEIDDIKCVNLPSYTVTFKSGDDELYSAEYMKGEMPQYEGETEYETDAYIYRIVGWDPKLAPVSGNATYQAVWDSATKYTVSFYHGEELLQTSTYGAGTYPYYEGNRYFETDGYSYEIVGWDPALAPVSGDASYQAVMDSTVKSYYVSFYNDWSGGQVGYGYFDYGTIPEYSGETPVRSATDEYTYTFKGWGKRVCDYEFCMMPTSNGGCYSWSRWGCRADEDEMGLLQVTGRAEYSAVFDSTKNKYTIKFVNYDGTLIRSGEYDYGTSLETIAPDDPERASVVDSISYEFAGWIPSLDWEEKVTHDTTFVASYNASIELYTIVFMVDDSIVKVGEYAYGTDPSEIERPEPPTKEATAEYTYTFADWRDQYGWSIDDDCVYGNAVYTPYFYAERNKYLVTFVDEDGTVLQSDSVYYGYRPYFDGEYKSEEDGYEFYEWTPERENVTEDAVYTATYRYRVAFVDDDGSEYYARWFDKGEMASYPDWYGDPYKASTAEYTYEFVGWDKDFVEVTAPIVYNAVYIATAIPKAQKVEIAEGDALLIDDFDDGNEISELETAWSVEKDNSGSTRISYEIEDAGDGKALKVDFRNYGYENYFAQVELPLSAGNGLDLSNCDVISYDYRGYYHQFRVETPYGAGEYRYSTWIDDYYGDGWATATIYWRELAKDEDVSASVLKTNVNRFVWNLYGEGTLEIDNVRCLNLPNYTVTFMDGETVLETAEVVQGETPDYSGSTYQLENSKYNDGYYYEFAGWTPNIVPATENAVYMAKFDSTAREYRICFSTEDDWDCSYMEYGTVPEYNGDTPTKEADDYCEEYSFIGWEYYDYSIGKDVVTTELPPVDGYRDYYAKFECVEKRIFTITYLDDNGEVLKTVEKEYDSYLDDYTPVKESTAEWEYTFDEWTPSVDHWVYESATYTASFDSTKRQYAVKFVNEGTVMWIDDPHCEDRWISEPNYGYWNYGCYYDYGTSQSEIALPDYVPTKYDDYDGEYIFVGWLPQIDSGATITSDLTFVATYKTKAGDKYTVSFMDGTDELWSGDFAENETPVYGGETPEKEDAEYTYKFVGWEEELVPVAGPAVYHAKFEKQKKTYEIVFLNYAGEEIDRKIYEYGAEITDAPAHELAMAGITGKYNDRDSWCTVNFKYKYDENYNYVKTDEIGWVSCSGLQKVTGPRSYMPSVSYVVEFLNGDGENIAEDYYMWYSYGSDMEYFVEQLVEDEAERITKSATDECEYVWTGAWTPEINNRITESATYTAVFSCNTRRYEVVFENGDGSEMLKAEYDYGTKAAELTLPTEIPTKAQTVSEVYTFASWDVVDVVGNTTIKPIFTASPRPYQVTFVDEDGVAILKEPTEYGYGTSASDIVAPADPKKEGFRFVGWTPEIADVTGAATYMAQYVDDSKVVVTWRNDSGELLYTQEYEKGSVPKYSGETPTKDPTVELEYEFDGWTPDVDTIHADVEYTAKFKEKPRTYTIAFVNYDGEELLTAPYAYGTAASDIELPEENPTKTPTATTVYTFVGWNPAVADVTGDATYMAMFASGKRTYTVVFKDVNGGVWDSWNYLSYGTSISVPDYGPQKETEGCTYEFTGWSSEYTGNIVQEDRVYTPTYSSECQPKEYDVAFYVIQYDEDDDEIYWDGFYQEYPYGTKAGDIVPPEVPEIPYTDDELGECTLKFSGWSPALSDVTGNAYYEALYSQECTGAKLHEIVFMLDADRWFAGDVYPEGTTAEELLAKLGTPANDTTVEYIYTFKGWTPEVTDVTGAATYMAEFEGTLREYTVKFLVNGKVKASANYPYGTSAKDIVVPDTVTKPATAQYTYTFKGWDRPIADVTGSVVYTAVFEASLNKYTVAFVNGNDTLSVNEYDYGTAAKQVALPDTTPEKAATAQYTYTFNGWGTIAEVTGNATYSATYTSTLNKYMVTFMADGDTLSSTQYTYGTAARDIVAPTPTKAATEDYTYTFKGWDKSIASVTGDATYNAVFDSTSNLILVKFMVGDEVFAQGEYKRGTSAEDIYPDNPTMPSTDQYAYHFVGWDPVIEDVTKPATYTAIFETVLNKHVVVFMSEGDTLLTKKLEYGTDVSRYAPANVTKPATAQYTYNFIGWDKDLASVTGPAVYTAVFDTMVNTYVVKFMVEGETVASDEYVYGAAAEDIDLPETPTKAKTPKYSFTFAGWSPEITDVTGEATYTARFDTTINMYKMVFMVDGDTVSAIEYPYGTLADSVVLPEVTKEATAKYTYTFNKWDKKVGKVSTSVTYKAIFDSTVNIYAVTFVVDGDTITSRYAYGTPAKNINLPDAIKAATEDSTYTFEGWDKEVSSVTGDVVYVAKFSAQEIEKVVPPDSSDAIGGMSRTAFKFGYADNAITVVQAKPAMVHVQVFDLNGQLVASFNEQVVGSKSFSLGQLEKGSYLVRVTSKSQMRTARIVVK